MGNYKNYADYRKQKQEEFNKLPLFFAFSDAQLQKELNKRKATTDDICSIDCRAFCLKSDLQIIKNYLDKADENELEKLMQDENFAKSAFRYEMENHEYFINMQGDWDVCQCFGECKYSNRKTYADYLQEIGYTENVIKCFEKARKEYYNYCLENDLF